jgi:hypothetical protein
MRRHRTKIVGLKINHIEVARAGGGAKAKPSLSLATISLRLIAAYYLAV